MSYHKPVILAQNAPTGSFAAGCPASTRDSGGGHCPARCELAQ